MTYYATDRHQPPGQWARATGASSVAGVVHRKADAFRFAAAARRAEAKRLPYGLVLERQPNNRHDPNAIAIYGVADVRGLFRTTRKEWHIGYVPADVAADVVSNLIDQGIPVAVELYRIYEGTDDYIDIKFIILAPPGNSQSKRSR